MRQGMQAAPPGDGTGENRDSLQHLLDVSPANPVSDV